MKKIEKVVYPFKETRTLYFEKKNTNKIQKYRFPNILFKTHLDIASILCGVS